MEFDQLMECNMRNILFEKSYAKCGRQTSPRPFSEKRKLSISLDKQSKTLYCLFLLYDKLRAISKLHTTWFYLVLNFFKKEGLELFSLPHFLHNFGKKKKFSYVLLIYQISLSGCPYFVRYGAICVLQLFMNQVKTPSILKLTLSS